MTLEELRNASVDLNEKPNHTHAAIPVGVYKEMQDLFSRVEEVIKEMKEGQTEGMWFPHPDSELLTVPASAAVKRWADRLAGTEEVPCAGEGK